MRKLPFLPIPFVFVCLLIIFISFFSSTSFALKPVSNDQVNAIAGQLRCPTCQGLSVKDSQAGISMNMKATIRDMLEKGKSKQEILAFFQEKYGEWILRSPVKSGWNWILWLAPFAFLIVVAGFIIYFIYKRTPSVPIEEDTDDLLD